MRTRVKFRDGSEKNLLAREAVQLEKKGLVKIVGKKYPVETVKKPKKNVNI